MMCWIWWAYENIWLGSTSIKTRWVKQLLCRLTLLTGMEMLGRVGVTQVVLVVGRWLSVGTIHACNSLETQMILGRLLL